MFGNWTDLMIGLWGALDLVVDRTRRLARASSGVTSFQMAEVAARRGESFTVTTVAIFA